MECASRWVAAVRRLPATAIALVRWRRFWRTARRLPLALHCLAMTTKHNPDVPPGFHPFAAGGAFMAGNGPLYLRRLEGQARFGFRVEARHCNPMGVLHGGMTASFCDMLLPLAVHVQHEPLSRRFLPTISLQVDYLAPAALGAWVEGTAELLRATRSLVFAQGFVTTDGEPCARASGVFKIGPEFPADFRG